MARAPVTGSSLNNIAESILVLSLPAGIAEITRVSLTYLRTSMARSSAIALGEKCFTFDGQDYEYERVVSLFFYYVVTEVRMNVVLHAGTEHQADLDIYVDAVRKPIKIRTGMYLTYLTIDRTQKRAQSVLELYQALAQLTFKTRLRRYVTALETHGFFEYDGKKVYGDGRVSDGKREINLRTSRPLWRKPFMLYYETEKSLGEKLLHLWTLQDFIIVTRFDADVFFFLLEQMFALRWDSE